MTIASSFDAPQSRPAPGNQNRRVAPGVRDRDSRHWSGPAFYAIRLLDADDSEHVVRRGTLVTVGCEALRHLYADQAGPDVPAGDRQSQPDGPTAPDMKAWSLEDGHADEAHPRAVVLRPLPLISLAYYQAPAPLLAIVVDRSVRNDASAEILAAITRLAP